MAAIGHDVCNIHGGKSLIGIASPTITTGKYSRDLPTRMLPALETARQDDDLLALKHEIALVDSRISDLLSRVDTGEAGEIWRSLQGTVAAMRKAERMMATCTRESVKFKEHELEREQAIDTIEVLCREGAEDYKAWDEVFKCIERRRLLQESEVRRLEKLQQFVTAERANLLMTTVLNAVRTHVSDPAVLAAVAADIRIAAAGGLRQRPN